MTIEDAGKFITTQGLAVLLVLVFLVFFARVIWKDTIKQRDDAQTREAEATVRERLVREQAQAAIERMTVAAQVEIKETRATAQAQILSTTEQFSRSLKERDVAWTESFKMLGKTLEGIHREVTRTRSGPNGEKRRGDDG